MIFDKKYIYLTYSDEFLKAIVVSHGSVKPKVVFCDSHSLTPGIVFNDRIADLSRFKEEVRRFLDGNRANFKSNQIIVGINEQDSFFSIFRNKEHSQDFITLISKSLADTLPFTLIEANIFYHKINSEVYQVTAVRNSLLVDLSSIFAGFRFNLVGLLPVPAAVLNLKLSKLPEPFIYVFSEERTLVFNLVVQNSIVFTTTLKLVNEIKNSSNDILKLVREIVEKGNIQTENPIKNIYYSGKNFEQITIFFKEKEFNLINISLADQFKNESASDFAEYTKCLLLASKNSILYNYQPPYKAGLKEISKSRKLATSTFFLKFFVFSLVLLLMALAIFFLINNLNKNESNNNNNNKDINKSINKIATNSFKPIASKSAKKTATSEASMKTIQPVTINKKEYIINVLNGTNTSGLASKAKDFLISKGYTNITIGNAVKRNYSQTVLSIKSSKHEIKQTLTSDLKERYSINTGSPLLESDTYDIIIIIGGK